MANEITMSFSVSFGKGAIGNQTLASGTQQVTVTGDNYIRNVQTVGFAAREALLLGDVATPGFCVFHNCDPTNYIELFPDAAVSSAMLKLKKGEWSGPVRLATATPYAKADTAEVKLECWIIPD